MKLATLASGSSGNSTLISGGKTSLLIDAGLSGKSITSRLEILKVNPQDITGIIVSHEHRDHTHGVGVLARKYKIPVYALEECIPGLGIGELPQGCCRPVSAGESLDIGELKVELFKTSHDSVGSTGLVCHHGGVKVGFTTDTGEVTSEMKHKLQGCDGLVFEANHDEEMLWKGNYPYALKKRIAAKTGHLSNTDSGHALAEIIDKNTKRIILAHLSEENNLPDVALQTVADILVDCGVPEVAPGLKIRPAPRHTPQAVEL
jgi:phosphoribosyl 1,2-cyclic phosphodiesterase